MLFGTALEFVSDRSIHRFLAESGDRHITCRVSVWRYSRHPNYLGEMSFWFGVFLCHAAVRPDIWYLGLGFLLIELLFLTVSIPMMERHNSERRSDYEDYRAVTSVLLLLPVKNKEGQVTESDGQD